MTTQSLEDRYVAEYEICKKRGHQDDGIVYATNPPQLRCKWCSVWYRYANEVRLIESAAPSKA